MKTPLEDWIARLAREAGTVKIIACHYAPGAVHHGDLIGITSDGATLPFWGCKTAEEVEAEKQDRRIRYAGKIQPINLR